MSLPLVNLDDKTFDALVKEAVSRIPVYTRAWTDHNIHDPGITFIELFAWLAEAQIYRLNRLTDQSYRKFLKLMGIAKLRRARPAEVDVSFHVLGNQPCVSVPAGTKLAAMDAITRDDIIFETRQKLHVVNARIESILSHPAGSECIDNTEANLNRNTSYYAFQYRPEIDDALYLGFNKSLTGLEITLALSLENGDAPGPNTAGGTVAGVYPSATVVWEYFRQDTHDWNSVEQLVDETRHLSANGIIRITIQNAMEETTVHHASCFWIRCRVVQAGYEIPPRIDSLALNTIPAYQVHTIHGCSFSSHGRPDFFVDLEHTPIIEKPLTISVNGENWSEVEDFDASKPAGTHYTVDSTRGRVYFGNGIHGKIPPKGENNICISYCAGGGIRGNVPAQCINRVLGVLSGAVSVNNMRSATGGAEPETLDEALRRAKRDMKSVHRAVTAEDYEYLALHTPGIKVARAKAIPGYHPCQNREIPGIMTVVVVPHSPYDQPKPSAGFLKTVYRHLNKYRLLTTELFLVSPEYVQISVNAPFVTKPKYLRETVEAKVRERLKAFLHPLTGGTDQKGWPFGRAVHVSEIYEVIDGVEGVDYVKDVTLARNEQVQEGDIVIPGYGLVFSGDIDFKAMNAEHRTSCESQVH